jgi:hypothetical protein
LINKIVFFCGEYIYECTYVVSTFIVNLREYSEMGIKLVIAARYSSSIKQIKTKIIVQKKYINKCIYIYHISIKRRIDAYDRGVITL